ncbi:DUF5666 domain-containing protein [Noviherbaspirillum massiliense]|uniref:DUF5666 domain-containing protein n=1 Tax=Noviherbaspirillum massiliense TaxID=1465823 RepID=UPI0002FA3A20|nr:DUF5666 domain-containing protein [Noviherbaspirillum massiliense]
MKNIRSHLTLFTPRRLWLAATAGLAAILIACGGGGVDVAGVGSGGTGAAVSGTVTGFGSVIVNGIRMDDDSATIMLDDAPATDGDLRLGMTVDIEGTVAAGATSGTASRIAGRSYVQGPVEFVGQQIKVLGVSVNVTPNTVYDDSDNRSLSDVSGLQSGDIVEVYGLPDAAGTLEATRIERKPVATTEVRLTGTAAEANSNALTFKIGDTTVKYSSAQLVGLPYGVLEGLTVRIKGSISAGGMILASEVRQIGLVPALQESQYAELEGVVTKFASAADFEINKLKVSLAADGQLIGTLTQGARVEVEGSFSNGVLLASRILVLDKTQPQANLNEVHGKIFNVDSGNRTFTMRNGNVTVKWDGFTSFIAPISSGDLIPGAAVYVKGNMQGNVLLASEISLNNR